MLLIDNVFLPGGSMWDPRVYAPFWRGVRPLFRSERVPGSYLGVEDHHLRARGLLGCRTAITQPQPVVRLYARATAATSAGTAFGLCFEPVHV